MTDALHTSETSLTRLFLAWQAGSRPSGDRFFRGVTRRLQGYARAHARDIDADDLLQDVFLTFVEHADGFDVSGGDGAIVSWFKVTLQRRMWAMSKRMKRERPAAEPEMDASPAVEPCGDDAIEVVEARLEAASRVATLREVSTDRTAIRFHRATTRRIAALADRLEAVLVEGAEPAETSGALAAQVGWSPFQLWQMSHRLEEALAPPQARETPATESVAAAADPECPPASGAHATGIGRGLTRAPVPSAAHRVSAPEAVTSGSSRESMRVELGAGARTLPWSRRRPPPRHRALSCAPAVSATPALASVRASGSQRAGCRDGPRGPGASQATRRWRASPAAELRAAV
ncbi:MAG: hypothetical protein H6744_10260 [Deltaproteobacteria bacterium]|nr:hypothetical protein [Deltaproteobacteria bacterium]MCB9787060.1 hypothetical protein [Deltaproteobacteria bacterium]